MISRSRLLTTAASCTVILSSAQAQTNVDWTGAADSNWTNPLNWNGGVVPTKFPGNQHANISWAFDAPPPFFPVIDSGIGVPPVDIFVGLGWGNTGRLDHSAGIAATGGGNWMYIGRDGGEGEYHLSGTGAMNVAGRLLVGTSVDGSGGWGTLNVHGGSLSTGSHLILGERGGGNFHMSGGQVDVGGDTAIGQNSSSIGEFRFSGGTLNSNSWVAIGRWGSQGSFEMTGGTWNKTGDGHFIIGDIGLGYGNHTGGVINVNNELWVGFGGGYADYRIAGSGELNVGNWLAIGRDGGQGVLTIEENAVVNKTGGGHLVLAPGFYSSGIVHQLGGTLNNAESHTWVGENAFGGMGYAEYNIYGGTANLSVLRLGHSDTPGDTTGSSTFNLYGGVVSATQVDSTSAAEHRVFNFHGGTLRAADSNPTFMQGLGRANIHAGGAVIDTGGHTITINQNLEKSDDIWSDADTGLTKKGGGTLVLGGNNTYEGLTTVEEGTLALASGASIAASSGVHLEPGATLDVSAIDGWTLGEGRTLSGNGNIAGDVTLAGDISPGNSIGALTFTGNVSLSGFTLMELDRGASPNADLINIIGSLSLGGDLTVVNIGGALQYGDSFTLFQASGGLSGGFDNLTLPALDAGLFWDNQLAASGILSVVPEPSAALLGGLGALAMLRRRRS